MPISVHKLSLEGPVGLTNDLKQHVHECSPLPHHVPGYRLSRVRDPNGGNASA